jgi:hypothetical protein
MEIANAFSGNLHLSQNLYFGYGLTFLICITEVSGSNMVGTLAVLSVVLRSFSWFPQFL